MNKLPLHQPSQGSPHAWTAAQLEPAAGLSKRQLLRILSSDCAEPVLVRGDQVRAWSLAALPEAVRKRIANRAHARCMELSEWIEHANKPWEPALPLSQVDDDSLKEARRLRNALLPSLEMIEETERLNRLARKGRSERLLAESIAAGQIPVQDAPDHREAIAAIDTEQQPVHLAGDIFERRGIVDYRAAFPDKKGISKRHWRRLIDRTIRRAGADKNFGRLELYLRENAAHGEPTKADLPGGISELLAEEAETFNGLDNPTQDEIDGFWDEICEIYYCAKASAKPVPRSRIVRWLWNNAQRLARTANGLRVAFDRRLISFEAKMAEGLSRPDDDSAHEEVIPENDKLIIAGYAAHNTRGRLAPAIRQMKELGLLSEETRRLIPDDASDKAYVNARVRTAVKNDIKIAQIFLAGKKSIDDITPGIERGYSNLRSMDCITADDFTLNNYFRVQDSRGSLTLTRGQCLLFIDCKSRKIIAWSLQPERNYCGLVIRTQMNRICRTPTLGIPRRAWYFEKGIWKSAKIVKGQAPDKWKVARSWTSMRPGWERLGVRFIHASSARAKPAEGVGGELQNLTDGSPGYCGRDERYDCPDAIKKAKLAVEAGRDDGREHFLDFDGWEAELARKIAKYNGTFQQGRLNGRSPDEAFEEYWPQEDPPMRADASCWPLVAHYVSERTITKDGIAFELGRRKFRFFDERMGQDRWGDRVLVWFDPEIPNLAGITDLKGRNAYVVERAASPDFLAEHDDPVLKRERERVAGFMAYPKARFHEIESKFKTAVRPNLPNRDVNKISEVFTAEKEKIAQAQAKKKDRRQTILRKAENLGIDRRLLDGTQEELEALDEIKAARLERAKELEGKTQSSL
jgi:hypothetical protein